MIKRLTSILDWDLWHRVKGRERKLDTEYTFKKQEKMKTIEVCTGIGLNQFFPETITIEIPKLTKKEKEALLVEMMKGDEELGLYRDPAPCTFDHNGECLICDAWPGSCAHTRYLNGDYSVETREELEQMFKSHE